jgi:hypothetical protein
MSKAAALTVQEASHKARAEHYLAETQKILRQLATERQRNMRHPQPQSSLVEQVKKFSTGNSHVENAFRLVVRAIQHVVRTSGSARDVRQLDERVRNTEEAIKLLALEQRHSREMETAEREKLLLRLQNEVAKMKALPSARRKK